MDLMAGWTELMVCVPCERDYIKWLEKSISKQSIEGAVAVIPVDDNLFLATQKGIVVVCHSHHTSIRIKALAHSLVQSLESGMRALVDKGVATAHADSSLVKATIRRQLALTWSGANHI
jgi:TRAP-type uncharacterized transport system fused permease subunit